MHRVTPLLLVVFLLSAGSLASGQPTSPSSFTKPGLSLRTGFVPNQGQWGVPRAADPDRVLYAARVDGMHVFLTAQGLSFVAMRSMRSDAAVREADGRRGEGADDIHAGARTGREGFRIDLRFEGADPAAVVDAYGRASSVMHYYSPMVPDGLLGVPEYSHVVYRGIYPRIDAVVTVRDGAPQYEFIVHPGGRPSDIRLRSAGAEQLMPDPNGGFIHATRFGGVRESAPVAWQPSVTGPSFVAARFEQHGDVRTLAVSSYDPSRPLLIDPWATYFGGNSDDKANAIVTNRHGAIFVAGEQASYDFPTTPGSFQDTLRGGIEGWYAKFSPTGTRLYATCYGGTGNDYVTAIAMGGNDDIVIAGQTASTNFPVGGVVYSSTNRGNEDMFIVKFDSSGARQWATYYGGGGNDRTFGMAVDSSRNIILSGQTVSLNFPTSNNAYMKASGGYDDGVIIKFRPTGQRIWATHFGGAGGDRLYGVAVGERDNLYFTGRTWGNYFPVTPNALQLAPTNNSQRDDAVIVKMDSSGRRIWATYLGGDHDDYGTSIAVNRNKHVFVVGRSQSVNFPTSSNGFQRTLGGGQDAFIASVDSACGLRFITYYGGTVTDEAMSVAADSTGAVLVSGYSHSTDLLMSSGAAIPQNAGGQDAFVLKLDSLGGVLWSSFYGGAGEDYATCVTASNRLDMFVAGRTMSSNIPTFSPLHPKKFGADAFVVMFTAGGVVPVELGVFTATWSDGDVLLSWSTEAEQGNAGFDIERRLDSEEGWSRCGFVPGAGTTTRRTAYEFRDIVPAAAQQLRYRLRQVDFDGRVSYSPVVTVSRDALPRRAEIIDLYPNPAAADSRLSFYTDVPGTVTLDLYDITGAFVSRIAEYADLPVGFHARSIAGTALAPGRYTVILRTATAVRSAPLLIVR